jgi:hypothetical protein
MEIKELLCKANKLRNSKNNKPEQWNLYITPIAREAIEKLEDNLRKHVVNDTNLRKDLCASLVIETFMTFCSENWKKYVEAVSK